MSPAHNPADSRLRAESNGARRDPPHGPCRHQPKGRGSSRPHGRLSHPAALAHNRGMSAPAELTPGASLHTSNWDRDGENAQLRAELQSLRDARDRAECMASIQSDAVQLALDLLVTHPDLRGFFRAFVKRLVDDAEAHACGVWLLDEVTGACKLWMANIGGDTLTEDSPAWPSIDLPRESMGAYLASCSECLDALIEYDGGEVTTAYRG